MYPYTMERKECFAGFNEYTEHAEVLKDSKKRDRSSIKQRFSDEQIRLLETIFESEAKLEPRKKAQLASELGLQPRQVAIWFQNRRARWRSKQIEQEYKVLKAKYDDLMSQFESLKEERQSLLIQLQAVNGQLEEAQNTNKDNKGMGNASINGNSVTAVKDHGWTAMPSFSLEPEQARNRTYGFSTQDALGHMNISDSEDCSLQSIDRWSSDNVFDQPCNTSNWSDFWT